MEHLLKDAEKAIESGNLDEGIVIVDQILNQNSFNSEALMLKATVFYKQQKWGDSLNALNRILEFDSENKLALNYKQMVMNILSFWNKDSYNP